ncbi:hypothetical protein [Imperialibacter roseus]|uniref:Lipoprotein n=1 Tax=Imperialibacter roseus TaxID=1324217 RepID=A0ABZ0IJV2_9BACT|nr:hypothetical protein [Imperialibacter roseus]WOK04812.1 hypothetical protein RT717_17150 [Imperialibacter roseus]|tara:strand:+ start:28172 stop:28714 length:543 start_codon:yes stop_codon:yes gene_type:complete
MKNTIFTFFLTLVFIQACEKDDVQIPTCKDCSFTCLEAGEADVITNDCIDDWNCAFTVNSDSKVAIDEWEGLANGSKNVFRMLNRNPGSALIDDELTDVLVFELDEFQTSFSVEGREMKGMNVHFRRLSQSCCDASAFKAVISGCMQGEKQSDGTWLVQGNLTIPYSTEDRNVKFHAQFL